MGCKTHETARIEFSGTLSRGVDAKHMCFVLSINGIRHLGERGEKCTPLPLKWFSDKCECMGAQGCPKCDAVCSICARCIAKTQIRSAESNCSICHNGKANLSCVMCGKIYHVKCVPLALRGSRRNEWACPECYQLAASAYGRLVDSANWKDSSTLAHRTEQYKIARQTVSYSVKRRRLSSSKESGRGRGGAMPGAAGKNLKRTSANMHFDDHQQANRRKVSSDMLLAQGFKATRKVQDSTQLLTYDGSSQPQWIELDSVQVSQGGNLYTGSRFEHLRRAKGDGRCLFRSILRANDL